MKDIWLYGLLLISVALNGWFWSREYSRWAWKRRKSKERGGGKGASYRAGRSYQSGRRYGGQRPTRTSKSGQKTADKAE